MATTANTETPLRYYCPLHGAVDGYELTEGKVYHLAGRSVCASALLERKAEP